MPWKKTGDAEICVMRAVSKIISARRGRETERNEKRLVNTTSSLNVMRRFLQDLQLLIERCGCCHHFIYVMIITLMATIHCKKLTKAVT